MAVQAGVGAEAALVVNISSAGTSSTSTITGDGTFQAKKSYTMGSGPGGVAAADFNGDGKSDLVTANYNDNNVSVLLSNGNGTFQAKQPFGTGGGPCQLLWAILTETAKVTW